MRQFLSIFVFLTIIGFSGDVFASQNNFVSSNIRSNPYQYIGEALRPGISTTTFWEVAKHLTTYRGFEAIFRTETVHNPLVFKQGGSKAQTLFPRAKPIVGPPFDIPTPAGVIPGCLHRLCPSPQGAIWFAGICWCTN